MITGLFSIVILYLIAGITRAVDEENVKWIVLAYAILMLTNIFTGVSLLLLLIVMIIKLPLFYLWLKLLYHFQDTIFIFIAILIVGGFLLGVV